MLSLAVNEQRKNFFEEFVGAQYKFGVIEKYYHQDDEETHKKNSKQTGINFRKMYRGMAAQVRKNFKRNILIVAPDLNDDTKKSFSNYFEQNFSETNFYILQRADAEKFICIENFSLLTFDVKEEVDALKDFAERFNVTEILIDKESKSNPPFVTEWLKSCGLPVKKFSIVQDK